MTKPYKTKAFTQLCHTSLSQTPNLCHFTIFLYIHSVFTKYDICKANQKMLYLSLLVFFSSQHRCCSTFPSHDITGLPLLTKKLPSTLIHSLHCSLWFSSQIPTHFTVFLFIWFTIQHFFPPLALSANTTLTPTHKTSRRKSALLTLILSNHTSERNTNMASLLSSSTSRSRGLFLAHRVPCPPK